MKIVVAPEYNDLYSSMSLVPGLVSAGKCKELYSGRNKVVLLEISVYPPFVVKKYKRHDWLKRVIYTFFRPNKARRSFENAKELRNRGFETPHEVAYIEEKLFGFITQVYYICAYTSKENIRKRLIDNECYDRDLAIAYARYVASLHEAGVLHRDLNPTNVLYKKNTSGYDFELIDINRMVFYDNKVPKQACMENLTLFWWLTDVYRFVLDVYAETRAWTQSDVAQAIKVKEVHDRNWRRRKRFTGLLKHYILGK